MTFKEKWMRLRNYQSDDFWAMVFARPLTILFLLPIIDCKWVTPNRLTVLSVFAKLTGVYCLFFEHGYTGSVSAAILINLGLVIDNMDGTVARYRNTGTKFGFYFDKATDAVTLVLLFWGMGYRGFVFTGNEIDIIIPVLAVTGAFIASYSKWVSERVMLDMKISEKLHNGELLNWAEKMEDGFKWTPPPQRTFTDWVKWLGKAFFSILFFNEVDIFFWAGLALLTEKYWIFTRFNSGFILLGLFAGPILFGVKVWRREKMLLKITGEQKNK
ncbi:MAG TPA: CDP-alcohol phosphatidyltransferase family protein [bacterium]|nr:CDP-alcohol phosphatidyltransferase family protein [bacterium]